MARVVGGAVMAWYPAADWSHLVTCGHVHGLVVAVTHCHFVRLAAPTIARFKYRPVPELVIVRRLDQHALRFIHEVTGHVPAAVSLTTLMATVVAVMAGNVKVYVDFAVMTTVVVSLLTIMSTIPPVVTWSAMIIMVCVVLDHGPTFATVTAIPVVASRRWRRDQGDGAQGKCESHESLACLSGHGGTPLRESFLHVCDVRTTLVPEGVKSPGWRRWVCSRGLASRCTATRKKVFTAAHGCDVLATPYCAAQQKFTCDITLVS